MRDKKGRFPMYSRRVMFALMMVLILGACNANQNLEQEREKNQQPSVSQVETKQPNTEKEEESQPSEPLTLTYFAQLAANAAPVVKTYNEVAAYEALEKITGIHIEWRHPVSGEAATQLNLMLASRNYTDIIEYDWINGYPGGAPKALKDGVIIPLNDLIEEHAPNFKKILEDNPELRKMIVDDEGQIYAFPFLRGDPSLMTSGGIMIRQDWLEKVNLPMPVTLDDWYVVLKAFKEQDPNGNGIADELPFSFALGAATLPKYWFDRTSSFASSFGIGTDFSQEEGLVKFGPAQPEYKQFLQLLRDWYEEGLIDPDYAVSDPKTIAAKVTSEQLGIIFGAVGGAVGRYNTEMAEINPEFKMVGVRAPVLNEGDIPQLMLKDFAYTGIGAAISTSNKNPVETVKWMDYKYSEEGSMLMNFGIEGLSYNWVDGYPKFTDEVMNHSDYPFVNALSKYAMSAINGPFVQDKRYMEQSASTPAQQESLKAWTTGVTAEKLLPPITSTMDESTKLASIMSDVNTYVNEMFNKFVMGSESLDQFDAYLQTLQKMGLEEAVQIKQSGLNRYNSR